VILVSTGTNGDAFDRLLSSIDLLGTGEELVVQHGPSQIRPRGARCVDYVSFDEYSRLVGEARAVVTHAGTGSVLVALMARKRPLVVPRLARHREAIDDHQLVFARRLAALDLAVCVEDTAELGELLQTRAPDGAEADDLVTRPPLIDDLRAYLADVVGPRRGRLYRIDGQSFTS
jgi:UDP-N-acetylglucosamine transferase subunit ALG13